MADKSLLPRNISGQWWANARKIVQSLVLVLFVLIFISSRSGAWSATILNLPFNLDPLAMAAKLLASKTFLAGSSLAIITILLTLVLGRVWCGWICPMGTLLDWLPSKNTKFASSISASPWGKTKYGLLAAILVAALFSNLTLILLDPITLYYRSLSVSIWPIADHLITTLEIWFYRFQFLQTPVSILDAWLRPGVFPVQPIQYQYLELVTLFFLVILLLNRLAPRFWCRFLCPLGAFLGLFSRFAFLQRKTNPDCISCSKCERSCPTGAIRARSEYQSDPTECILCMNCLETCRYRGNDFVFSLPKRPISSFNAERRTMLGISGITLGALLILRTNPNRWQDKSYYLQPPGGLENDLIAKCIRCGECIRACPTGGLQVSLVEGGIDGLMTPHLVPRTGFCDFGCNRCGQVCPVEAIPRLDLEEKRQTVIGLAYIDKDRCIAWADGQDCIVCEEMCPLPQKAITLETSQRTSSNGEVIEVLLPQVDRNLCIGCGICEYKCPVDLESAIRIFSIEA